MTIIFYIHKGWKIIIIRLLFNYYSNTMNILMHAHVTYIYIYIYMCVLFLFGGVLSLSRKLDDVFTYNHIYIYDFKVHSKPLTY